MSVTDISPETEKARASMRATAIEAAANAALQALQICQALRTLNGAGAAEALSPTLTAVSRQTSECDRQLKIISETLIP